MDKLKYYRKNIDLIDKNIVKLLMLRFKLVRQIGNYKRKKKIDIADKKRELRVINNIKKYTKRLHQKFMTNIFENIIDYSRRLQSK